MNAPLILGAAAVGTMALLAINYLLRAGGFPW